MKPDCPNCRTGVCSHILDYSDKVVITITRVKSLGVPSHWEYDLDSGAGGTNPSFYGAIDMAIESITGDTKEFGSTRNTWVDFNANERNENG